MTCYHPLKAYNLINQSTPSGKAKIVFSDKLVQGKEYELIDLPCSQCIGCRMDKSKEWAVRCMHESELYSVSTVVTLTIDDEHLPEWKSLDKAYFRNFMKRLRKSKKGVDAVEHNGKLIWPIRYFQCGEYGDDLDRPHHHAILFNCEFEDKEYWKTTGAGTKLYHSEYLDKTWEKGYCYIGDVSWKAAAYIARYALKKVNGDMAPVHYAVWDEETGEPIGYREPEYVTMSRMPGIGKTWYDKYKNDCYPKDYLTSDGRKSKVPKYYDRLLEKEQPKMLSELKSKRKEAHLQNPIENMQYRLRAKEMCQHSRNAKLPRS